MRKIISITLVILFFMQEMSFALSPEPASRVPATQAAVQEQAERFFVEKYGPVPIDLETGGDLSEDICITISQIRKAYKAFNENRTNRKSYDLLAPKAPHKGGYTVAAGLEVALADMRERRFTDRYIKSLRQMNIFSEEFLKYLSEFTFNGDIDAVPEGTVITSGIPIMRIRASDVEIALLEGLIKNRISLATNIATKTARIVQAANGEFTDDEGMKRVRTVADFGLRRAQSKAAYLASRAAMIGGAFATSNVRAGSLYKGVKLSGTMAHLYVQTYGPEGEMEAFRSYAEAFPDSSIFLIDTYDTLQGARNAAVIAKEMAAKGHKLIGVRLDSGDLVKLSGEVRKILNAEGLDYVKIFASDDLDEEKITDLIKRGAMIDAFGVGTNLITGGGEASLELELQPSYGDNIFRIYDNVYGQVSRYITTPKKIRSLNVAADEKVEELLLPYWRNGERVRAEDTVQDAKARSAVNLAALPYDIRRLKDVTKNIPVRRQVIIDPRTDALIVVDAQTTFMPGGGLAVVDGDKIMKYIKQLMVLFPKGNRFATRDQHPKGHISLASSYTVYGAMTVLTYDMVKDWTEDDNRIGPDAKFTLAELKEYLQKVPFQVLWPDHGMEGTSECQLHPDLNNSDFEEVLVKGTNPRVDSYSGFFDNVGKPTGLAEMIRKRGYKRVFVVGLAKDYCVGWTAEGAKIEGFEPIMIDDATKPVGFPAGSEEAMCNSLKEKDISLVPDSDSLMKANSTTQIIRPPNLAKSSAHPVITDNEERTALTEDMYHLTMGQALFRSGRHEKKATFDYFYRTPPYGRDSIVVSGLKNFIEELRHFKFTENNIEYLRSLNIFDEDYLRYLKDFEFHGNIDAMEDGSAAYPREPIMRVRGTVFEVMIIETFILNIMNFNSLEATWAEENRKNKGGAKLKEDLLSFAQGRSHAEASRSAYLGGDVETTNLEAHTRFDVPLALADEDGEWLAPGFITGGPRSSLGGVYKLAVFDGEDRIKLSDNPIKTSLPGDKMVFAIVDQNGKALRRVIANEDERFGLNAGERAVPVLRPIVRKGRIVYSVPGLEQSRKFREEDAARYKNIHKAELSKGLAKLQADLIAHARAASITEEAIKPSSFKIRDRSEPTFANINIMGPCNLNCRFCLGNDLKAEFDQYNNLNTHFNDWKNFKSYVSSLKAKGINKIYVTGQNTDPLQYKYLDELVGYLKSKGFYIGLRTNGILAQRKMDIINKFDSVSYTLLTLSPDTLDKISPGNRNIVDWDYVLTNTTTKKRVAIVVTRENAGEVVGLLRFLSKYKDLSYIQVRKMATDTRYGLLKEDMQAFEALAKDIAAKYPKVGSFELAPIYMIEGKEAVLWRTVATTVNSWNYFTNGVYSDNYFIIEGYLENKYKTMVSDLHAKARFYKPADYPDRYIVPDDMVDWGIGYPGYSPKYYDSARVIAEDRTKVRGGYADPADISLVKLPEDSYEGPVRYKDGAPLNPKGRTGLAGRGALGKWGPNYAADPIITRFNEEKQAYEMLVVERGDSDKMSIPGVILLEGETSFGAIRRRLGVKIGQDIPMEGAVRLYKGYVDDQRNTDNAWLETEVYHLNLPYELTRKFPLQNKLGKTAAWMTMTDENISDMYANHGDFARLAMVRLQPDMTRADKRKDVRDTLKRLLDPDKPVLAVFDTHGVLLRSTWKEELRRVYRELVGDYPTDEWMERHVVNKLMRDAIQAMSKASGKNEEQVKGVVRRVRREMREYDMPEVMPGALEFVRALKRAGVPELIMSGTKKSLILRQLGKKGFLGYIDEDQIVGGPSSSADGYDREKVLRDIQTFYPHHQMILFDDWVEGVAAVKALGGISLGLGQGRGAELAVNQQRLLEEGIDFPLDGWNHWQILYQVLSEHNRNVLKTKRFGHVTSRTQAPPVYGKRFDVPEHKVAWEIKYPGYRPKSVLANMVVDNDYSKGLGKKWADPADFRTVLKDISEGRREPMESYEGPVRLDKKTGLPLNPRGRTGIKDRGVLGKYGPNQAADPVLTRTNPVTGEYEVLLVRRKDNGILAFPGGFRDRKMADGKAILEDTLEAAVRELREETSIVVAEADIVKAVSVYKGYVDDWRNTDNAWAETEAWHFHVEDPELAMRMIPKVSDEGKEALWVSASSVDIAVQNPPHALILNLARQRLERQHPTNRDRMRVAMAQINCIVGDMPGNREKILDYVERAKTQEADMVVFPEMTITGYSPEDQVYRGSFVRDNLRILRSLAEEIKGITAIVGFIDVDDEGRLYNAAAVIADGKIKGVYRKKELPNDSVFDEERNYAHGETDEIYDLGGIPFGVNICQDVWIDKDGVYLKQAESGAKVLINISASPYYMNKLDARKGLLQKRVMQTDAFYVYTNLVGGQDEVVYDGGSFIMGPNGQVIAQAGRFEEELVVADLDITQAREYKPKEIRTTHIDRPDITRPKKRLEPKPVVAEPAETETIYNALVRGLRDYCKKNRIKKVVLGLSGGVDSALVAAIAVDAIGRENVLGISMPTHFNSAETRSDARKVAEALGINFRELPIEGLYKAHLEEMRQNPDFAGLPEDVTEENIQPRLRMMELYKYSNKFGYLVLNTTNKSELAVGYGTVGGDLMGGFAPISDVYKTTILGEPDKRKEGLAEYVNRLHKKEVIPVTTIRRPPSAELKDNQKDSDALPPYPVLDPILKAYIEKNESIAQMSMKWDRATVERVVRLVDGPPSPEHKRRTAPLGVKITERNLRKDWRQPVTNRYREGKVDEELGLAPAREVLTVDEKQTVHESVNLMHSQRLEILMSQATDTDLTEPVKDTIERIKRIGPEGSFNCRLFTENNLRTYLENSEKGVKRIIMATKDSLGVIKSLLDSDPMLFRGVKVINIDLPSVYFDDREKGQLQGGALVTTILAGLYEKDSAPMVENLLRGILLKRMDKDTHKVDEFMARLGSLDHSLSAADISAKVLYFLGKIVRFSDILEKENRMIKEFLTYA